MSGPSYAESAAKRNSTRVGYNQVCYHQKLEDDLCIRILPKIFESGLRISTRRVGFWHPLSRHTKNLLAVVLFNMVEPNKVAAPTIGAKCCVAKCREDRIKKHICTTNEGHATHLPVTAGSIIVCYSVYYGRQHISYQV